MNLISFLRNRSFIRLDKNHDGQAVLSGNIQSDRGVCIISRTILFSHEMNRPDEISLIDTRYVKNPRDIADGESFKSSFLYIPEGTVRQLKIKPTSNGWLIGNLQSPYALCVNR